MTKDSFSITSDLKYIFIPAKVKAGEKSPVLVLLHGVGSNERDLASLASHFDQRFAVVSVRAPLTLGTENYGWFHVKFTPEGPLHNQAEAETSRKLLTDFITQLRAQPGIDPSRVFVLGFSQGAIMGLSLAFTEPELFHGLIAIAGRTLQEVAAKAAPRKVSPEVLLIHGKEDNKLPYFHAEATESVLKRAGYKYEFQSYEAGHELNEAMLQDIRAWLDR